ncbi:uncharacterized protein LOC144142625 [Haemaphysalis longicornis]
MVLCSKKTRMASLRGSISPAENTLSAKAELNAAPSNVFIPCDICGDCFSTQEDLRAHLRSRHGDGPHGKHQCSFCPYSTCSRTHLRDHLRTHTKERPFRSHAAPLEGSQRVRRPYGCHLCPSSFSRRTHLEDHVRTHTKERPFGCEHCGQRFTQSSNLVRHRKTHARAF